MQKYNELRATAIKAQLERMRLEKDNHALRLELHAITGLRDDALNRLLSSAEDNYKIASEAE